MSVMAGVCWCWSGLVSVGQCWSVMVRVQMDLGFSFDAAPTIDTVLYFRKLNGDRQRRWRRLESTSSSRTSKVNIPIAEIRHTVTAKTLSILTPNAV